MKRTLLFISSVILLVLISCTRENNSPAPTRIPNTPPVVNLGSDILNYPFPAIRITPNIVDAESNVFTLKWTKLSGPEEVMITQSSSNDVLLKELKNGIYKIELSVTDIGGTMIKDTLTLGVNLQPIDNGEFILNNRPWTFYEEWWGQMVEIPSFRLNVAPDKKFKVYIQRDNDPAWIEAFEYTNENAHYVYYIEEFMDVTHQYKYGDLLIFDAKSNDLRDTPNVKIVF